MSTNPVQYYTFTTASHPPSLQTHTTLVYPTPSNPWPATNHPVFTDAMTVRHAVFVDEQHCSADAEIDDDDARSWEFVIYANPSAAAVADNNNMFEKKGRPVGVVRLVPPPHAPHEALRRPERADELPKYDVRHEAYVKVTRVAVLKEFRGYGLARRLMTEVEEWARQNKGSIDGAFRRIVSSVSTSVSARGFENGENGGWNGLIGLHAQVQVEKMYERFGYVTDREMGTWDEEGIEHVGMFKRITL